MKLAWGMSTLEVHEAAAAPACNLVCCDWQGECQLVFQHLAALQHLRSEDSQCPGRDWKSGQTGHSSCKGECKSKQNLQVDTLHANLMQEGPRSIEMPHPLRGSSSGSE